ncbi:unnamed protein product, partial [Phaeothamnion confervicola]
RFVPRVTLELTRRGLAPGDIDAMGALLAAEARRERYDGFVLELPLQAVTAEIISAAKRLYREGGSAAAFTAKPDGDGGGSSSDLLFILVAPPGVVMPEEVAKRLDRLVHRYSLMTYDFAVRGSVDSSSGSAAGGSGGFDGGVSFPNAPLPWVRQAVDLLAGSLPLASRRAGKVLVGLPFYGYDNGRAVLAHEFLAALLTATVQEEAAVAAAVGVVAGTKRGANDGATVLRWDAEAHEHVSVYAAKGEADGNERHVVTYPTPRFLADRIAAAAAAAGAGGIAIWELGQGMPLVFDLF